MPASHNAHDIAAPVLIVVSFAGSCFSWIFAVGDDALNYPYPVLIGSISTVGMTLIVLYGKFREMKIEKDRQEKLSSADQKNDHLLKLINKMCERMRRQEGKIRRLESRLQNREGTQTNIKDLGKD